MIYEWQKQLIGKNKHSVLTKCFECLMIGVNFPMINSCGNCGHHNTITYYDSETIDKYLSGINR